MFQFENGRLLGPVAFSTLGMRIQNELSGSSSLFAQPLAIEPVPDETRIGSQGSGTDKRDLGKIEAGAQELGAAGSAVANVHPEATPAKIARGALEARMEGALAALVAEHSGAPSSTVRQAHLSLLKRWYYRPEARRSGEIFFPDAAARWPVKAILRGAGRIAARMLIAAGS